jgi:hypothetical protein
VRQKGNPFMQSCNRFLNEYENYCIINCLLELNSPACRRACCGKTARHVLWEPGAGNRSR